MPIYEYTCKACGHALEAIQKFSDPALRECPACRKPELKKQISAGGFQLKGSGWYATDSKSTKKPATPGANESTTAESAAVDPAPVKKAAGHGGGSCDCH